MSKARVLMVLPLAQPEHMMWVRATLAPMIDLNFKLPNWLRWMKSLLITVN